MTGDGLVKRLAVCETAEVEGLAPAVFVEVGSQIVVTIPISTISNIEKLERKGRTYCLVSVAYSALRA